MEGLAPVDGWAVLSVVAKTLGYGAALLAIGGTIFVNFFPSAHADVLRLARRLAVIAALIGLTVLALRFGIRAARISGMGLAGATDPIMLGLVWDSPLGTVSYLRGAGAILILAVMIDTPLGRVASLLGAVLSAASFALIGHSLGDPRWLLAGLLTVHVLAVGFWVGALAPLYRAAPGPDGARLLHRFGVVASAIVPMLILVGIAFASVMVGSVDSAVETAYGRTLLTKVALVAALLGLASLNKLRLVPALRAGQPGAVARLQRSIRLEILAVALILTATATLTSLTTPPANL